MHEILIKHYETVRQEILERIRLRQTVLVLYLGFVGTVLGFAFSPDKNKIGIVIPFVSFGVAWIIRDHELLLGYLGQWLKTTYDNYLRSNPEFEKYPQWDSSPLIENYAKSVLSARFIGYICLLLILSIVGLVVSWCELSIVLRIFGIAFTTGTFIILIWTYFERKKSFVL